MIQPTQQAFVYDTTNDAKSALNAGQVDGLVLDLPTAAYVSAVQIPGSTLVGQFESTGEHFGMLFEKDNPLVTCVNSVLDDMRSRRHTGRLLAAVPVRLPQRSYHHLAA